MSVAITSTRKLLLLALLALLALAPLCSSAFHSHGGTPSSSSLSFQTGAPSKAAATIMLRGGSQAKRAEGERSPRQEPPLLATAAVVPGGGFGAAAPLAVNLAVDAVSAGLTALCVAPLLAAFDEAITRSASGEANLWTALGARLRAIVTKPGAFLRSAAFRWMFVVYAATYATANSLKTIERAAGLKFGFASTLAVTMVNMACGIAKDAAYAKMFGRSDDEGGKVTPVLAYIVWFVRDVTAFTFILTLPPIVSGALGVPIDLATFTTPIFAQYFTTIFHLLGFNICNDPDGSVGDWLRAMKPSFFSTVAARQMRIIPPYSIGGVLNAKILSKAPLIVNFLTTGKR